ncbi:MAG TPA: PIG-L family deacetylase [Candidatus Kapabacteria bacterium]|jgi:LmbE family N-acetylglucosaminyl deacetylase|nr:PIG-L family deacetylase [Candidatus Kapabacteria bacterium]
MSLLLDPHSNITVIVAHPDDEALGCGGTVAKLADAGHNVRIVLPLKSNGLRSVSKWDCLIPAFRNSCQVLGAEPVILDPLMDAPFAEVKLNELHDLLLPEIERADVIMTHWSGDAHQVHRAVSRAVEIATRPFRRCKTVLLFEVPTSTDQGYFSSFVPTLRVILDESHLERKCSAMKLYQSEHAPGRTSEELRAKVMSRGSEAGARFAEAFVIARAFL